MEISLSFHYDKLTQDQLKQYISAYLDNNDLDNSYTIIPYANKFTAVRIYLPSQTKPSTAKKLARITSILMKSNVPTYAIPSCTH